jgi:hypothetical protein
MMIVITIVIIMCVMVIFLLKWNTHVNLRYGAKAAAKLATVRGKDFRHEKTKRKRSYVGGKIDMSSHSIKFSNSDDEN